MWRRFASLVVLGIAIGPFVAVRHSLAATRVERSAAPQAGDAAWRGDDELLSHAAEPPNSSADLPVAESGAAEAGEPATLDAADAAIENQLWLVNTRTLPHAPALSSRRAVPEVSRYRQQTWQRSSLDELLSAHNPRLATAVFVHGNDTDEQDARGKGTGMFHSLSQGTQQPFRLIVWSWPADYVRGTMRQDARIKAERADGDAFYLAHFIRELNSQDPVSLVAFSLGARVTTGALHLLGGGTLDGRTMVVDRPDGWPPIHAVLMAPAVDDDSLLPGRRHGRALTVVERMVLLVNPRDRVLRWYRFISPRSGVTALGSHGLTSLAALGPSRQKIEQINVRPLLGGQHGWSSYTSSPEILEQLKREILRARSNDE